MRSTTALSQRPTNKARHIFSSIVTAMTGIVLCTNLFFVANAGAATFSVPGDYATIQQALSNAPDGSAIEVQAGVYNDFIQATNLNKDLYLKALGTVEIRGGGTRKLLHIMNDSGGNPDKNLLIDGFTFRDGYDSSSSSSPVTIANAKPQFINCTFTGNKALVKGGAVLIYGPDAHPLFHNCNFTDNESLETAGAVLVNGGHAQAIFKESLFENNTNRKSSSAAKYGEGGAIAFSDGGGKIINCIFRGNSTAYAGGAVMVLNWWNTVPDSVEITGSHFENNYCLPVAGKDPAEPTEGGAVMVENNVSVSIRECSFTGNQAESGGAISNYRANLDIFGSVFDGNSATGANYQGFGGAIGINMNDAGDSDRREGTVSLSYVLLRNSVAPVGGGLYIVGDISHGKKASLTLDKVVLDSNRATTQNSSYGNGGGLFIQLADCSATGTYVLNNTAEFAGGGIVMVQNATLALSDSYIVGNSGIDAGIHNPDGLPVTESNTVWAYNGGGPSVDIVAFAAIPPVAVNGIGYLTYVVSPYSGPPSVNPGGMSLPDRGGYAAGTLTINPFQGHTLFSLTSGYPPQEQHMWDSYGDPYFPWTRHDDLGWIYYCEGDNNNLVLWSPSLGVFYTGSYFPNVYLVDDGAWYLYLEGTSRPAYFLNLYSGEWEKKYPYF